MRRVSAWVVVQVSLLSEGSVAGEKGGRCASSLSRLRRKSGTWYDRQPKMRETRR
jgi:hypothetical protein